ncbi:glutamate receptor ionotropic, kainate 2 [Trichonephila clavipes]|nr:glutamate receptor ionotropic, kainate 2 [Trichonephila clavipes]
MLKSDRNLTGNDRFEGFCIDLLRTIAELLGFNYDLYLVPDNKFGAENTTSGEWSGLVREIIEKVKFLVDHNLPAVLNSPKAKNHID